MQIRFACGGGRSLPFCPIKLSRKNLRLGGEALILKAKKGKRICEPAGWHRQILNKVAFF
ncbi:MAG: hypothetical protein CR988_01900 [Treponema sp.]|nr:MAG: hypothetical protein CR988_01900 [Treponema sp.]